MYVHTTSPILNFVQQKTSGSENSWSTDALYMHIGQLNPKNVACVNNFLIKNKHSVCKNSYILEWPKLCSFTKKSTKMRHFRYLTDYCASFCLYSPKKFDKFGHCWAKLCSFFKKFNQQKWDILDFYLTTVRRFV